MNIRYLKERIISEISNETKTIIYGIWRCLWKIKTKIFPKKYHSDIYNTENILYVNPSDIIFTVKKEFDIYKDKGKIVGGDWDKDVRYFSDMDFYTSFKRIVKENCKWQDTNYYRRLLKDIRDGEVKFGCRNREDLDNRCSELEEVFKDIKNNGYRKTWNEDEITVNIGRNGEILFNNGRHRLTFCKLAKIEKIPVRVTVRHREWVNFKERIFYYCKKNNNRIYSPLLHPDLESIPSNYDDTRFQIINDNLTCKSGKLLDIGGHWGYFCAKFEDIGFDCYCVENSNVNLYYLKKLREIYGRDFKIVEGSIFSVINKIPKNFDVILALSIFHHFLKKKASFNKLKNLLRELRAKELFIESHNINEKQMKDAYRYFSPDEFIRFIIRNSLFSKYEMIGYSDRNRPIYRISNGYE